MINQAGIALKCSDSSKHLWLCRIHLYTHPLAKTFIHTNSTHVYDEHSIFVYSDVLKKHWETLYIHTYVYNT